MSWIKGVCYQLIIFLALLEFFSFVGSSLGLFLVNDTPTAYKPDGASAVYEVNAGRTEKHEWGAWRIPLSQVRHVSACFDVEVSANEIGARDTSFEDLSSDSVLLLGDSFAEAFGVSIENSAQARIEKNLGRDVLNFGSAGDFGLLQSLLLYREFKDKYAHNQVVLFVLPANDFTDNDYELWGESKRSRIRYRPYWGEEDPLVARYFPEAVPTDSFGSSADGSFRAAWRRFVVDYLWSSNLSRTVAHLTKSKSKARGSFYVKSSPSQQAKLVETIKAIIREADERSVAVVVIPTQLDIENLTKDMTYKNEFWFASLASMAAVSDGQIRIIDLMDYIPADYDQLFHVCDGHWSTDGNRWAAEIISAAIL